MHEGQPEPGKRDQTLQKTQNNYPMHQEREVRPSTVLCTLPHEGGRRTPPGRDRGKPSGRGVAGKTLDLGIQLLVKRGGLLPLGRGFAEKPEEPRAWGKGVVTMLQALGETPAERGTLC
jgi:hypothetical protein